MHCTRMREKKKKERRNETSDRRLLCPMYHVEGTRNKIGDPREERPEVIT